MAIVRTEAFVLKAIRFGETSMIYRLFTRDQGVVPVIARGARRPKNRFGAALDSFHRLGVTYHARQGREIQTLTGVELLAGHPGITRSLERMEAAGTWFRFLRAVVPDGAPVAPLYQLAAEAMARLETTPPNRTRRWQAYHMAAAAVLMGIAPQLETCAACGRPLPDGRALAFAVDEGGVVCAACHAARAGSWPLTAGEYALLTLYHHPDYPLVEEMEPDAGEEHRIQDIIYDFIRRHADLRTGVV
jgi:DNA repair protein RecO (recombination protein O)